MFLTRTNNNNVKLWSFSLHREVKIQHQPWKCWTQKQLIINQCFGLWNRLKCNISWPWLPLKCLIAVKSSSFRCCHRFKYSPTHPPILSPFFFLSCLSLQVINKLCKTSMKAVFWNKDIEACKVSSWRMLNHQSFYCHPEYKWVSSGFIPWFFLSSVSHLPLAVSSPLTTAKHWTFSSIQGQWDTLCWLSSCLCVFATFGVFAIF